MDYLIVKDGIIENVAVFYDEKLAKKLGALPYYVGAEIGQPYTPEPEIQTTTLEERVGSLEDDTKDLHEALDMILTGVTE